MNIYCRGSGMVKWSDPQSLAKGLQIVCKLFAKLCKSLHFTIPLPPHTQSMHSATPYKHYNYNELFVLIHCMPTSNECSETIITSDICQPT